MQMTLPMQINTQDRIAGQPIVDSYLHSRLPYTIQVIGGAYSGESLVYLLHFEQAYHHTRHYIGSSDNLEQRLKAHRRKYPYFVWNGKAFKRYATFYKALQRHYSQAELDTRKFEIMRDARRDTGVSLLMAVNRADIPWRVAQVWQADRSFEYYLKRRKHASRFCPICQGIEEPF